MKMFHKSLISLLVGGTALFGVESAFATCTEDYAKEYRNCVSNKDNLPNKAASENAKASPQTKCINDKYQQVYLICLQKKEGGAEYYKKVSGTLSKLLEPEVTCRQNAINTLVADNSINLIAWPERIKKELLKCADDPVIKKLEEEEKKFPPPPPPPAAEKKIDPPQPKPIKDTVPIKKPGGDDDTPEPEDDPPPPPVKKAEEGFNKTITQLAYDYTAFVKADADAAKKCMAEKIPVKLSNCRHDHLNKVSNPNRQTMNDAVKQQGQAIRAEIDAAYAEYEKINKKKADAWKKKQDAILGSSLNDYNSLARVYERMKGSKLPAWPAFESLFK